MTIQFNNNQTFTALVANEQKLFEHNPKTGTTPKGWMFSTTITGAFTSALLDELLNPEVLKTITIYPEDGGDRQEIKGYEKIQSLVVRHYEQHSEAEIQLSKGL